MIDVAGTSRSYIVTLPANYNASQPHPLVFTLHGRTGTAMQIARGNHYNLKSRMTNAIFVAGQGLGTTADPADTGWPNTNGQDIAFVRALLAWMNANYCVDQARVFSTGFSYGGIMSHTIGCQMSDVFRAIAPMAGARLRRRLLPHPSDRRLDDPRHDGHLLVRRRRLLGGRIGAQSGADAQSLHRHHHDGPTRRRRCASPTRAATAATRCTGARTPAPTIPTFAAEGVANFFLQF